jgi:hypothetical protein
MDDTNNFVFFLIFIFIKRKDALYLDITKTKQEKIQKNPYKEGFIFFEPDKI